MLKLKFSRKIFIFIIDKIPLFIYSAQCYRLLSNIATFTSFWKTNRSHLSLESNGVLQFDERDVIVIIIRRITAMLNHFIDMKFLRLCLCSGITIVFQYPDRYEVRIEPVVGIRYARLKISFYEQSKAQNCNITGIKFQNRWNRWDIVISISKISSYDFTKYWSIVIDIIN